MLEYRIQGARFGNYFFINTVLSFLSKKNNLKVKYEFEEQCKDLGVELFFGDKETNEKTVIIHNDNFLDYIMNNEIITNYCFKIQKDTYFQTKPFCLFLKKLYEKEEIRNKIIHKNQFNIRYNNNNDLFVHIRLGDVTHLTPGYEYYDYVIGRIQFTNGYISSDSIHNKIVTDLVTKYKLKVIQTNEVDTIKFASTCKHLILSHGTFSWLIGFLGFYSNVFYPKIQTQWHGDIFTFPEWNEVNLNVVKYNK